MSSEEVKKESISGKNDVYSFFEKSLESYFKEVRKNAASYLQAVSDLQQEIVELRRNNASHILGLQKTAMDVLGRNRIQERAMDITRSISEQNVKAIELQNKLVLSSLAILSKNIEAFNRNSQSFSDINKAVIDSWTSIIKEAAKKAQNSAS